MSNVLKANGQKEEFSEEKILDSIKRAGIPTGLQDKVLTHVKSKLYEGIPTTEVYHHINEFLSHEPAKFRYGLKQAIMEFGPTGYPFEDLITQIMRLKGYQTQTRTILMGKCVNHEIDVIAEKSNEKIMIEAKFHNAPGIHTDLHVSLYTNARFEDLKDKHNFTKPYLFTNTKITPDALAYALCVGMEVTGWNYPQNEGLRDLIEKYQLHPLTLLSSLSQTQKQTLLEQHIVLINEILKNSSCLDILGLSDEKKQQILDEAKQTLH
jgi:hypothetical protein